MEKDPKISVIIKESGVVPAPDHFTESVMKRIDAETVQKRYEPIIGKTSRICIILFFTAVVVIAIFFSEPGSIFIGKRVQQPDISLDLQFLSEIHISTVLVSVLLAIFILVLSDAGFRRKRLM
jgi:hypothetical protein